MLERMLVPLDTSETSRGILPYAASLARRLKQPVHLVSVIPDASDLHTFGEEHAASVQSLAGQLRTEAQQALAAAGVMRFEDALRVVRQRGQFMQEACEATKGGMAAIIGLDEAKTREACAEAGVELANLNCPGQIVISGPADRMDKACEAAKAKGAKKAMPLPVAGGYHSQLMASAQPKLEGALRGVSLQGPAVTVVSNVTAQPHGGPSEIAPLLVRQVTSPVRWEDSMRWLIGQGYTRFIELGPGKALSGFMKRIDGSAQMLNVGDAASLEATVQALAQAKP